MITSFMKSALLSLMLASALYGAQSNDLKYFDYPAGCFAHPLKPSQHFNRGDNPTTHLHKALNIIASHKQDVRLTPKQKGAYQKAYETIAALSTYLPVQGTDGLYSLPTFKAQVTQYKPETPFTRSRGVAITAAWRGAYLASRKHDYPLLPKYASYLKMVLDMLKHECEGTSIFNLKRKQEYIQRNHCVIERRLRNAQRKRTRPDNQPTIDTFFKRARR